MAYENQRIKKVIENWLRASKELDFHIIVPYTIQISADNHIQVSAFLPDYGKPKGMIFNVIEPFEISDKSVWDWAEENGVYCSFLSVESYLDYDVNHFMETLKDWGHFGLNK